MTLETLPPTCAHSRFEFDNSVRRVTGNGAAAWVAEIKITCTDCGEGFLFAGLAPQQDVSLLRPASSMSGSVARLPIIPSANVFRAGGPLAQKES